MIIDKPKIAHFDGTTDGDVSITEHGLVPVAPNDTSKFLRGDGTWAASAAVGAVPIGGIVAYLPGYFNNNSNGTYTEVVLTLPSEWHLCDGSAVNDAASPIWVGAGRYLPRLDDSVFIQGYATGAGGTGGVNDNTLTVNHIPQHSHTINHGHTNSVGNQSANHTHSGTTGSTSTDHKHIDGVSYASSTIDAWNGQSSTGTITNRANGTALSGSYMRAYTSTAVESVGQSHTHSFTSGNQSADHNHTVTIADYSGSSGNYGTASPTVLNNRPNYLSCYYIVRIK